MNTYQVIPVDPIEYLEGQNIEYETTEDPDWVKPKCQLHHGCNALKLNTQSGQWHCDGGCGAKGRTIFDLHAALKKIHPISAIHHLDAADPKQPNRGTYPENRCMLGLLQVLKSHAQEILSITGEYVYASEGDDVEELTYEQIAEICDLASEIFHSLEEYGV